MIPALLLTYAEVATRLAVSPSTVRRLVAAGKLAAVRPTPGCPRIAASELERYVNHLSAPVVAFPGQRPPPAPKGRMSRKDAAGRLGLLPGR